MLFAALSVAGFVPRHLSDPNCSATACPSKCSCSEQKCAAELSACLADAACVKGQACASACPCGSNVCLAKCGILHPSLKAASLLACTEKSCSSLEDEAEVQAAGACTDAADQAAWESKGKAYFAGGMADCIMPCVKGTTIDSECSSKCIATEVGFTAACANCFGALEAEALTKCAAPCRANPKSVECSACETEMLADLKTCTGFTDIPRPPSAAQMDVASLQEDDRPTAATDTAVATAARSWKSVPHEGDMPVEDLQNFWSELETLQTPQTSTGRWVSFPLNEIISRVSVNSTLVPDQLHGIWLLDNHPTFGHAIFSFIGGDQVFDGANGRDEPGYVYASFADGRTGAIIDNPGNRSKLQWFHDHKLQFSFPKFNTSLTPGHATGLNADLPAPYHKYPLPAAILEGASVWKMAQWEFDPKRKTDPALCFCSAIYEGPDVILRNNFGRFAYKMLRLFDGEGVPTKHWDPFQREMAARKISHFAQILG